ncbi:MAG: thioredoxin domain-containing protein [Acidobacteria bacterium]|nr:thioredoxin domain-containing protein [Acidobacteriota bacterium]
MTDTKKPAPPTARKANRLAREKSPYLLQHAFNPVDWYPWGEEAFRTAREKGRPIFLSIGYSTCHWCHVMERESFENEEVAAYLNENFVAIKVDREERPDVDAIYMSAVQAMTGSGGWPLSVFLAHDLKPFYGGTYFPPDDRFGRPGFLSLLHRLRGVWDTQADKIGASGAQILAALEREPRKGAAPELGRDTLARGRDLLAGGFDPQHGGFSGPPKFPRAHEISFLLRQLRRAPDDTTLGMITTTLDAMADGGIHDQLGGGFHRYSTDALWLVPHFEKMLYDQALLSRAYLEAHLVTGRAAYAGVARDIFTYVLRDLRDARGGFHSAEDADSEGEEGLFYVFKPAEIRALLGADAAKAFGAYYGVTDRGNFEGGASILHVDRTVAQAGSAIGADPAAVERILADGRRKLLAARGKRVRPHLDDKVLTDWNGMMISSLAYGSTVLDDPAYARAAAEAADFVLASLQRDGRLLHRYRDGSSDIPAFLDDYACFGQGLLDLYEATLDPRWLAESQRLARDMIRLFRDDADGALTLVGRDGEKLIVATKEIYDGAQPSGNSVAALWLLKLADLTADSDLEARAREIVRAFAADVTRYPAGYPYFLMALDFAVGPTREIVIAGERGAPETKAMLAAIRKRFLPDAVVALHEPGAAGAALEALVPFVKAQAPLGGKSAAYVCRDHACERPTADLSKLEALLDAPAPGGDAPAQKGQKKR